MVTWIYLDFIIYFELFLQGNMDLWCRLITNICKLFGDSFGTMGRTMGRTFDNFSLPPRGIATLSVESGGGSVGGAG